MTEVAVVSIGKVCKTCGLDKPLTAFWRQPKYRDGRYTTCAECLKEGNRKAQKEWRDKHPGYHRKRNLKKFYGITVDDYHSMLATQGGGCAICRRTENGRESFCVDHDHKVDTRKPIKHIRGLLCDNCNRSLGLMGDSPTIFRIAAEYLERNRRGRK